MSQLPVPTPGADRLIVFHVRGQEFRARRPSRADDAEINRRLVRKLAGSGSALESDLLNAYDGARLFAEAQFEVLLLPRVSPGGEVLSLGEHAPDNWFRVRMEKGTIVEKQMAYDEVPIDEFDEARIEFAKKQKKSDSPPPSSTEPAATQNNG